MLLIIVIFFRVFALRAWIVLGLWFALQVFSGLSTPTTGGGVAYWAHAGGFGAGLILTLPLWLRRGGSGYWSRTEGHPPHPEARLPAAEDLDPAGAAALTAVSRAEAWPGGRTAPRSPPGPSAPRTAPRPRAAS